MDYRDKRKAVQNKTFYSSLKYAIEGIITSFAEEKNMKRHVLTAIIVLIGAFILRVDLSSLLWLIFSIFFVIICEIMNTAIENLVDLVTNYEYHPLAKKVKDMMAGLVLLSSVFAVIVGIIVLIQTLVK